MSVVDPLSALRECVVGKTPFRIDGALVVLGEPARHRFPIKARTIFRSNRGQGDHYTVGDVAFFLQSISMPYGTYIVQAKGKGLLPVLAVDKKNLIDYLNATVDTVPELDRGSLATFQAELAASEQQASGSTQAPVSGTAPSSDPTVSAGVETLEHWMAQETRICTRETAMRAASGKDFSSLIGVLDAALSRKKSDADSTSAGKRSASDASSEPAKRARTGGVPIIIVPSALTSLITMHNAHAFLQKGQWMPPSATTAAPKSVFIERPSIFDDTKTVKYEVIDSANDLKSEDWDRVVAVFTTGQAWQFQSWKWKEPAQVFNNVCGFNLNYDDEKPSDNIKNWRLHKLLISKSKRHMDCSLVFEFWNLLKTYIAANPIKRTLTV